MSIYFKEHPTIEAAQDYLTTLDLSYIVDIMCAESYPLPRWVKQEAERCAGLYKNFLYLQCKHRDVILVPSRAVDEFWHNHLLHTKLYFRDCERIFGRYLHHEPASRESNDSDVEKLVSAFLLTQELYFKEFNEDFV